MPILESKIQRAVVTYARSKGFIAIKLSTLGTFGSNGWPDYVFFGENASTFFIEFKAPGKKPTPLQRERATLLTYIGFRYYVVSDVAVGKAIIDYHLWTP